MNRGIMLKYKGLPESLSSYEPCVYCSNCTYTLLHPRRSRKKTRITGNQNLIPAVLDRSLSSCKFCDEIAVFHEGAVIQHGTHVELVADVNGKYQELWNAQAQYYTEKTA